MLSILHVDPERGWGGGEVQVLALVRHLDARGYPVAIAADPAGALWRAARSAGIDTYPLSIRNGFDLRASRTLRALAGQVDVIHFHTARAHALALWLGHTRARRVATRRMDYRPRPRSYARFLYNRSVDRVVAISRRIRDVLVAAGVRAERITVIPSGVDVERFSTTTASEDGATRIEGEGRGRRPTVLVLGSLVRRKGHAVLLEAVNRLARRGVSIHLSFCGDGPCRAELERHMLRLGLGDEVEFLGWRDDVATVLAGADIVAVPSLHEGLGVAALEAMAAARPVVASRVGGLAEIIIDRKTGWLVPPDDPETLAAALAEAASDPIRARRYGAAARHRVTSEFSMIRMTSGNEGVYRTLATGASG